MDGSEGLVTPAVSARQVLLSPKGTAAGGGRGMVVTKVAVVMTMAVVMTKAVVGEKEIVYMIITLSINLAVVVATLITNVAIVAIVATLVVMCEDSESLRSFLKLTQVALHYA